MAGGSVGNTLDSKQEFILSRSVQDPTDLNNFAFYHVKHKIFVYNQDPVPKFAESFVIGNDAEQGLGCKETDGSVDFFKLLNGCAGTVFQDIVENLKEIPLGRSQVSYPVQSVHAMCAFSRLII
jgi:hypothetical protein